MIAILILALAALPARATNSVLYEVFADCGPPDEYIEIQCCSPFYQIGYNFTFGCNTYNAISVSAMPSITFNSSASQKCWDFDFPSISPYFNFGVILTNGSVYGHNVSLGGENVLVIEWTGIYTIFPVYVHTGTVQLWLFRNGTFGIIYHLTGQFFSLTADYCLNSCGCYSISEAGAHDIHHEKKEITENLTMAELTLISDTELLRGAEAFLFTPNTFSCNAPYIQNVWTHPPDKCYTPFSDSIGKGDTFGLFIPPVDCTLENSANLSYCSSRGAYPNAAYNASGILYDPLKVCPADLNPNAVFNHTTPPPSPSSSGSGRKLSDGAIAGIIIGAVVVVTGFGFLTGAYLV
jgi:hypothetical protein